MEIHHNPLPTLVISGDGALHDANPSARSLAGLAQLEVRGLTLERVLMPAEGGPRLERFLGELLTRGQARFDGLLLTQQAQRHRITAWGWRPDPSQPLFWLHLIPAPQPRTNGNVAPTLTPVPRPAVDPLAHLTPSLRALVSHPARVDELMRLGASSVVCARELLHPLLALAERLRGRPEFQHTLGSLMVAATSMSEHAERLAEVLGAAGELEPARVDLAELLGTVAVLLEGALPRDIHVSVEVEEGVPPAWCNMAALEQALMALCANARDAMPVGGGLVLAARLTTSADHVAVEVRDTGSGMTRDQVDEAFAATFTTRRERSGGSQRAGLGLGLPLVRELMERMGGDVELESTLNVGTCVRLTLPAYANQSAEAGLSTGRRPRVLVVEDDGDLRRVTARLLDQSGMVAVCVNDGADALQLLSDDATFSAVLLDLHMPRAGGEDVLAFLSVQQSAPPVVVFTSDDVGAVGARLRAMGAFAVVGKPFRGNELISSVRDAIRSRGAAAA
ncbi:MAG: ATP-binding protein [Myxococcota bacterium]